MGPALGGMRPLAIGVAISVLPIIAIILMLITPKARSNGRAFVAGWVLGLVVGGAVRVIVNSAGPRLLELGDADGQAYLPGASPPRPPHSASPPTSSASATITPSAPTWRSAAWCACLADPARPSLAAARQSACPQPRRCRPAVSSGEDDGVMSSTRAGNPPREAL